MEYALIKGGTVHNVIVASEEFIALIAGDLEHIEPLDTSQEQALGVGIGWGWDGAQFVPPAAVEPAPAPAEPMPAPAPVSATVVTVGNTAAADKSVAAVGMFGVKDKIIVSVKTDASTPADATIDAKLTFQDGQVAGQKTQAVKAEDAGTTNIEFTNTNDWPAGKYKVDVTVNGQPVGMTQGSGGN